MQNARLDESQARIKIAGRNINNLRYADGTTLMAESKLKLKSLFMKVKEESEKKAGLKLNIQKTKIVASRPITSWWNRWGRNRNSDRLYSWAPKSLQKVTATLTVTLAPWKKSYDKPRQHIKKQTYYFANKFCLVKAVVFPVFMYGCECWTIKKAERK